MHRGVWWLDLRGEACAHPHAASLTFNDIGEGGARALADALAKNTELKELK